MSVVRGSRRNAVSYSEANDIQQQYGKRLAITAEIKHGDKVLDMGCGTGELTGILAQMVGKRSQVVGVDPDKERINVAIQLSNGIHENISFIHGDSSSKFPHFDEQYYDVFFSSFVFQWLNAEEKRNLIHTAFQILKPGGKIAVQSHEENCNMLREAAKLFLDSDADNVHKKVQPYFVHKSETEILLRKEGFVLLKSEYFHSPYTFASADDFLAFVYASDYYDDTNISQSQKSNLFSKIVNKDGTVTFYDPTVYQIIGRKSAAEPF